MGAGGSYRLGVESLKERHFRTVLRQAEDFSCGAAALASLLTFHYRRPTAEDEVFRDMLAEGDAERIRGQGFSLLDMKRYLARRGIAADGFRITLDKLVTAGLPAISLIETKGYRHFVLIKGANAGEVLVGDPASGVWVYPHEAFQAIWHGIVFIIRDEQAPARSTFNRQEEWALRLRPRLADALALESLADATARAVPFSRF